MIVSGDLMFLGYLLLMFEEPSYVIKDMAYTCTGSLRVTASTTDVASTAITCQGNAASNVI